MRRRPVFTAALALALAGCASGFSNLPLADSQPLQRYTLGPGDSIKIAVYGFDAMAGTYLVSDAGTISLPLLSTVAVSGVSAPELEARLAGMLRAKDLAPNANVSVQVDKYRPFYILGEVERPGQYAYVPGMTVLTAISIAGGYTFRADKHVAAVSRTLDGKSSKARLDADGPVHPGDTIIIPEAAF